MSNNAFFDEFMEKLGEQWVGYDGVPKSTQFGLKSLRLGKALKPGYVLTIEPGIYFAAGLITHIFYVSGDKQIWACNQKELQFILKIRHFSKSFFFLMQ